MIIRSRAPLRLGLAGGGTDLESYSNQFGGAVFNATIGMYAYCTIIPTDSNRIQITAYDNANSIDIESVPEIKLESDKLILHRGVYNRIVKEFNNGKPLSFIMSTSNDAPIGSGLGTSSTMVVAILEAFNRWLCLGLTDYQKAQLAYDIERKDLKLAGGKQDQYAAVFGGFNYMEFKQDGSTLVHNLHIKQRIINEFECSLILHYSGYSRKSADQQLVLTNNIISNQISNTVNKENSTIAAMADLKKMAVNMKTFVSGGDFSSFADCLKKVWETKKKTSSIISNTELEQTINFAMENGAEAVKVSGAGGGGFLLLYCNPINREKLISALSKIDGKTYPVTFDLNGVESWVTD